MNKHITRQPEKLTDDVEMEEATEVIEYPENDYMPEQRDSLPLELWRQLQAYLVLDTIVELPEAEPSKDKSKTRWLRLHCGFSKYLTWKRGMASSPLQVSRTRGQGQKILWQ